MNNNPNETSSEFLSPFNILIVEDDMLVGTHISMLLTQAGYEVMGILTQGEMVLEQLKTVRPDLILMDVKLKGELDGIDTAKQVYQTFQTPVIFLTANTDKATFERAKKAYPIAFIAKPFKALDLTRAIELAASRMLEAPSVITKDDKNLPTENVLLTDRIFVRDKDRMVKLKFEDIHYVKAERNYCQIFTEGKNYLLSVPLKTFEKRLTSVFFERVHRSFVVNLKQIDEIDETHVYCRKQAIPISKSHKELINQRLGLS
jgi:DNA-binding LytR/AlgR family response regulator